MMEGLWANCSKYTRRQLTDEALRRVAGARSRGLEMDILEAVRNTRMKITQATLDAQDNLGNVDPKIL